MLEMDAHALGDFRNAELHVPCIDGRGGGGDPCEPFVRQFAYAASQKDLRGLGRSVERAPPAETCQLSERSTRSRSNPIIGMLPTKPAVHQPLGKPECASCEAMTAEVARLPNVEPAALERPEERAAMLSTAAVSAAMGAHQADRLSSERRVLQHAVEAQVQQVFKAVDLDAGNRSSIG